jgi:hypothetical protein
MQNFLPSCWRMLSKLLYKGFKSRHPMLECFPFSPPCVRARFHGRLELDMRVQPALQHALLEYRLCRDWRDWRPNWISFSTQPIACLHENKVTAFLFCPPFCPRFPPVQASHGNALLVILIIRCMPSFRPT